MHQYQEALSTLTREAMGQWRWRDAIALADRWLASEPLSDEAVRLAIEARYLAGDRGAALARLPAVPSDSAPGDRLRAQPGAAQPDSPGRGRPHAINARPITDEWYARAPSFEASLIGREKSGQPCGKRGRRSNGARAASC